MEALGINLGYLFVQIFNFAIMFVILRAFAFKPIIGLLEKRRAAIAKGLEDARVAAEARQNAEQEAEKIMAEAQAEASKTVRNASERAEKAGQDIFAAVEEEARGKREEALLEAEQERERILGDMRDQVAKLAIAAAHRLIGESLDEKRQHAIINEFFSGIKEGQISLLVDKSLNGGASAEITSAVPLSSEEKEIVKQDILSKIGTEAEVAFRVDPAILGGLVVRVEDKVLDGSVTGQLESLRLRL
ncbi:MAG: F0F1 ATP synthase subunit B [Anaerolineales bacterium]|nr:F0F1 ATP synthase subunit B [Anaerolineales bacterium]